MAIINSSVKCFLKEQEKYLTYLPGGYFKCVKKFAQLEGKTDRLRHLS